MEQNNIERLNELNTQIEAAATELQGINIPVVNTPVVKKNNAGSIALLVVAGVGTVATTAWAVYGGIKLGKAIKAKALLKKEAAKKQLEEVEEIIDEFEDDLEA